MVTWLNGVQRQSWNRDGGDFTGGPPKGVIHTTETQGWPSYSNGAVAPHLTIRAEGGRLAIRQHSPLNRAARALRNEAGGVQTNRDSAIQIELIGTCNPAWRGRSGYYYWPEPDDWAVAELAAFMRQLESACGITRTAVATLPYPTSYGRSPVRMSLPQWDNYSGWCGHQHVPENSHGDPGSLDIVRLCGDQTTVVRPVTPPAPPTTHPPPFPLPRGAYFGPRSGPTNSRSGYYSASDRAGLRTWQARMRQRGWTIDVDGLYGDQTARVTRAFQVEKRLAVDGLIGPATWAAAWTSPIT